MVNTLSVCFFDGTSSRKNACRVTMPDNLFHNITSETMADIFCAHANDLDGNNADKSQTEYAERNPGKLIIIYSAGGCYEISQSDLESKRVLIIQRVINDHEGAITKDEWNKINELIDWKTKTFIRSTLGSDCILFALSILCQGYLATHKITTKVSPEIEDALVVMKTRTKASSRKTGKNTTDNLSWWNNCFDDEDIIVKQSEVNIQQSSQNERSSTSNVIGKITHEWESNSLNNSKLSKLLRAIYGDGTISAQTVAEAYCAIIKHSHH
jgi:hypothetical protein